MTKRLESKFRVYKKLSKNYNNIWGLPKGEYLRCSKNGSKKKKKASVYGNLLRVKQSLRYFYCNMQERSFKRILKQSVNSPLTTLDRFVSFLESRLDIVLFRSCFASSLHKSRQMISHGHILVNGKRVRNPSTNLSKLDIVEVDKTMEYGTSVLNNLKINFSSRFVPAHLEIDYKTLSVIFLWDPNFEGTYYPIKANYEIIQRFYK